MEQLTMYVQEAMFEYPLQEQEQVSHHLVERELRVVVMLQLTQGIMVMVKSAASH